MSNCRACTAFIRWAVDSDGRSIPLDEHEQLDYDPPRPPVTSAHHNDALGPGARYRILQDGARPIVELVPPESTARTYVDHRWICQQPRVI